jgi:hypothetical protein
MLTSQGYGKLDKPSGNFFVFLHNSFPENRAMGDVFESVG